MEHMTHTKAPSGFCDAAKASQVTFPSPQTSTEDSSPNSESGIPHEPAPPRTHLSTPKHNFEVLASRTVSQAVLEETRAMKLPASPLDSINPSLYPRFPRFSMTTESSQPDLSTDEMTSTKISLDEEVMLATRRTSNTSNTKSSKRQKLQTTLHRAVSTPSLGLRRIGDRMKRAPSIFPSRKTSKGLQRSISESQSEVLEEEVDNSIVTQRSGSPASHKALERRDINIRSLPGTPVRVERRLAHKLSNLPEDQTSDSETAVSRGQLRTPDPSGVGSNRTMTGVDGSTMHQPSSSTQSPPKSTMGHGFRPSVAKLNSYHALREPVPRKSPVFLGRASSWSSTPNAGVPRSISLGSIDELRCNSFVSTQQRVFSVPTMPSRQLSLVDSTPSTPRQGLRTLSVCELDDLASLNQLRREPMFVGIHEGHHVNFVFPESSDVQNCPISPSRPSLDSRPHSYRSLRQKDSTPLLVRSSNIQSGLEETRGKTKIPLFVPSQIIKPDADRLLVPERKSSRPSPDLAVHVGGAAQDQPSPRQENHSKEALSDESDWSTTVQFEAPKPEVFQPKSEASVSPDTRSSNMQEVQPASGNSCDGPRRAQAEATASGLDGVESLEGCLSGASQPSHRMRVFQACSAYFQRVKKRLWRSSSTK